MRLTRSGPQKTHETQTTPSLLGLGTCHDPCTVDIDSVYYHSVDLIVLCLQGHTGSSHASCCDPWHQSQFKAQSYFGRLCPPSPSLGFRPLFSAAFHAGILPTEFSIHPVRSHREPATQVLYRLYLQWGLGP